MLVETFETAQHGLGVRALESLSVGSVAVPSEAPLVSQATAEEEKSIAALVRGIQAGKFQSMLRFGALVAQRYFHGKDDADTLLDLCSPPSDAAVRQLANQALSHLRDRMDESIPWDKVKQAMLVWSSNSFQGGRIYPTISRINHSCNPNAVIVVDDQKQSVVAATQIHKGEEVTISYLDGCFLYADRTTRQNRLLRDKYFSCACPRCRGIANGDDFAHSIPCTSCHERSSNGSLDEETQYDDEQDVSYCRGLDAVCEKCQQRIAPSVAAVATKITLRVANFLEDHQNNVSSIVDGEADPLQEHLSLTHTVLGDQHWTTNMLRVVYLDRHLAQASQQMVATQEPPSMDELAEWIDMLERVERFILGMNKEVCLDVGHLLSNAMIGVARLLVALGDQKSQKYASTWLEKISDYVLCFETEGIQKVVAALKVAWKQTNGDDTKPPATKKAKRNPDSDR